MLPSTDLLLTLGSGHGRQEEPVRGCTDLGSVPPESDRESGHICRPQGCGFDAIGTFHAKSGDVREELTEEIVGTGPSVHLHRMYVDSGVGLHGLDDIVCLEGYGLQCGPGDVTAVGDTGQSHDDPPGV